MVCSKEYNTLLLGRLAGGISGESSGGCSGLNVGNEGLDWVPVASGGLHNSDTLGVHNSDNSWWVLSSLVARCCSDGSF